MKTFAIFLTVLIATTININAQIPNNGFESWHNVGNCIKPIGWQTTNDYQDSTGSYFGVTRSTDHYPTSIGNYSIRIENNVSIMPDYGAYGFASIAYFGSTSIGPGFAITGHPNSLNGYYKFLPQNGDTMYIQLKLYFNSIEIISEKISSTNTVTNWTPFTINLPSYTQADSAAIIISPYFMDGPYNLPYGNSVLYIDNLSFDNLITSLSEQNSENIVFSLYPNPATDIVTIVGENLNNADLTINVYSVFGTLVKSEMLKQSQRQINIRELSSGIYLVAIKSKDMTENKRLIIQR